MEYSAEVLRRFSESTRQDPVSSVGAVVTGEAQDRTLGVWVRFQMDVVDGLIAGAAYEVYGCPHTVAAADWVAEWLTRRPLAAVSQLDMHVVAGELEVPVRKRGKLLRIEDALVACMDHLDGNVVEGKH